jgi:ubiquinone/menaquinone biosynthesis C-methylase UbiE
MPNSSLYDEIGQSYTAHRQADSRLTNAVLSLLQLPTGASIADIGAGTGNYSLALAQKGYQLTAIEPSAVMQQQAKQNCNIAWISGLAEQLPLNSNSVQASIGILSMHHFKGAKQALDEMARISKNNRVLLFTFDPRQIERPWLADYFPFLWGDTFKYFPPIEEVADWLARATGGQVTTMPFELPHDLKDFFAAAGWRRPELYLNATVRSCMSGFAIADQHRVAQGVKALRNDLETGAWDDKYGWLRGKHKADIGYRFVLSGTVD